MVSEKELAEAGLAEANRQDSIHSKGFNILDTTFTYRSPDNVTDYNKIKVGVKTLDDAVITLGDLSRNNKGINKGTILKALSDRDIPTIRRISEYFYNTSGIYMRICNYMAQLYRYDWYIIPEINDESVKEKESLKEKIVKDYTKHLNFLDSSYIKKMSGEIALKVIKNGCYYGYIVPNNDRIVIQELPIHYCRTRYSVAGMPITEFNMSFFDDKFSDVTYRMKVLKLFPDDFAKGYMLYKQGKLGEDDWVNMDMEPKNDRGFGSEANSIGSRRKSGWYMLDPGACIKFNLNGSDMPIFASAIPALIDLDAAQDLSRRKQLQELCKIIIQKLPLDKNGDLIFDVDEARDIHNNTVQMLKHTVNTDVITTFADVDSIDLNGNTDADQSDVIDSVKKTVYDNAGLSWNLFNTSGNLSLEKSILNDESTMRNLLLQFAIFYDTILQSRNLNKKKYNFRFYMLETTQYNYKELSKTFKEQVNSGYSKILPQVALGLPQSAILNTAYFENEILDMPSIMIPPLMSSTINGEDILGRKDKTNTSNTQNLTESGEEKSAGRPAKSDDEKSEKTIQNLESQS